MKPNIEELQRTIYSLQAQLSDYIGKYTSENVERIRLQEENKELKEELEKYREKEIETMDAE